MMAGNITDPDLKLCESRWRPADRTEGDRFRSDIQKWGTYFQERRSLRRSLQRTTAYGTADTASANAMVNLVESSHVTHDTSNRPHAGAEESEHGVRASAAQSSFEGSQTSVATQRDLGTPSDLDKSDPGSDARQSKATLPPDLPLKSPCRPSTTAYSRTRNDPFCDSSCTGCLKSFECLIAYIDRELKETGHFLVKGPGKGSRGHRAVSDYVESLPRLRGLYEQYESEESAPLAFPG